MEMAKAILEVQAGVLPGVPMDEYNKRWVLTRSEWDTSQHITMKAATDYAKSLINPAYVNWVRFEWVYL